MNTSFRILLSIFSILLLLGCREEEEVPVYKPIIVNDYVTAFDLVKVYAPGLGKEEQIFEGYFSETIPVTLGRSGEDSLVFIMPELPMGRAELKVEINGKPRIWKFNLGIYFLPPPSAESVFDALIRNNEALLSEMGAFGSLDRFSQDYLKWISQLKMEYSQLNEKEKKDFEGVMTKPFNKFWLNFLKDSPSKLKVPACEDYPIVDFLGRINFVENLFSLPFSPRGFEFLAKYTELPDSKFYRSIKTGIGLSFWYQIGLMEALAAKTLTCPILRNLAFKIPGDQPGSFVEQPTLILESGEMNEVYAFGEFQKPNMIGLNSFYEDQFRARGERFKTFKKSTSKILVMLANGAGLPIMEEEPLYIIPASAPLEQIPFPSSFPITVQIFNNPEIRFIGYGFEEGKLKLELESLTGLDQDFVLNMNSRDFEKNVPAKLKVFCPMLAQVVLDEGKIQIDIQYGSPPYQINWSNGLTGTGPFDFTPGAYTVQVLDSDGCEESIEFEMPEFSTVTDIDGNVYKTVNIGNQWWMAENLRTTRKSDGSLITKVNASSEWAGNPEVSVYAVLETKPGNDQKYGNVYSGKAVCCGICPTGWRYPESEDWHQLQEYLGPSYATKMKTYQGWENSVVKGSNISGFSALPTGYIEWNGMYEEEGLVTYFRVPTKPEPPFSHTFYLLGLDSGEEMRARAEGSGGLYPVRCVKD
ncbi:fibrobacter succinogenes major paralogous domain-containing protein [Cognataquiflexum rubidum]|uniref:fibrobacter succinogenes major paralogous domain-containing protein n=1 Tax=Cognataquiflexum rubidum TaxID=2922273 RepID=UPI001F13739D|nr:fibrobacter succinogenes major paralogous domain-containing protein [Cognataquiflexum rubidum]MCH6235050.1 fibrobacter succinogenes major paralogous domain-containing protein [Cognataquiflexum rubidum]